jgi:hemerythrin superfamily protein
MREHGVLRRILLIYEKCITMPEEDAIASLKESAEIVHSFVENYHEKLEEEYIFPRFKKADKQTDLVKTLLIQHEATRKLTDSILKGNNSDFEKIKESIKSFIRTYRPHASREDTVLFPEFKKLIEEKEYNSLGEVFEQREEKLFGENGFSNMIIKVESIEKKIGIYELEQFTPKQ